MSDVVVVDGKEPVREIPAANVRSSLERLESATSQVVRRLENVKTVLEEEARENEGVAAPSTQSFPERKLPSEILTMIDSLISVVQPPADGEPLMEELTEYPLPPIDEISHLVLVSHSIIAYLRYLNRDQLMKMTSHILTDTNRWLSNMFRFADCQASYHSDGTECLVRAIRLALACRFPGYFDHGIKQLPEVSIYVSGNSSHIGLQFACRQIGLPASSVRLVPYITIEGGLSVIDVSALQKCIALDVNAGRAPLFMLADVGASRLGEADNVARLQEVCRLNKIWFHCRGHALASLILMQVPGGDSVGPVADSLTLNLSSWFGIPGVQAVLLHRTLSDFSPAILFDSDPLHTRYLAAISIWMMLQVLGKEQIIERILGAFTAVRDFYEIVTKVEGLCVLSKPPGAVSIADLIEKPLNLSLLFETAVPVVIFKFNGGDAADDEEKTSADRPTYHDRLNSWLGQILQRDTDQIDLELIKLPNHGMCIRFCPLELGIGDVPPNEERLHNFASCIDAQVEILRATVKHRQTFNKLVKENPLLQLIHLEDWAGLGGVRYVPEFFDLQSDHAISELNKINCALVDHLRASDSAFSLGEGVDQMSCVRFGMVTEGTDVNELLEMVIDAGQAIQEDSKLLDSMSEIVRKGIEAATLELQRENEEKLWQEGILRHVPVVGHFVNWFSPPGKEGGVKGRSLNLTQGVVESTENIYKYHMQLPSGGNQAVPAAASQTPVSGHSRSESQSSTISANKAADNNSKQQQQEPTTSVVNEEVEPQEVSPATT